LRKDRWLAVVADSLIDTQHAILENLRWPKRCPLFVCGFLFATPGPLKIFLRSLYFHG